MSVFETIAQKKREQMATPPSYRDQAKLPGGPTDSGVSYTGRGGFQIIYKPDSDEFEVSHPQGVIQGVHRIRNGDLKNQNVYNALKNELFELRPDKQPEGWAPLPVGPRGETSVAAPESAAPPRPETPSVPEPEPGESPSAFYNRVAAEQDSLGESQQPLAVQPDLRESEQPAAPQPDFGESEQPEPVPQAKASIEPPGESQPSLEEQVYPEQSQQPSLEEQVYPEQSPAEPFNYGRRTNVHMVGEQGYLELAKRLETEGTRRPAFRKLHEQLLDELFGPWEEWRPLGTKPLWGPNPHAVRAVMERLPEQDRRLVVQYLQNVFIPVMVERSKPFNVKKMSDYAATSMAGVRR